MNALYDIIGVSRQSFHQKKKRESDFNILLMDLIKEVDIYRQEHPGCGLAKLYFTLQPNFLGRDRFILILKSLGYQIRRKKNPIRTTYPSRLQYPNLINAMEVDFIRQVWQTDITYFYLDGKFYYLTFLIDIYSRMIVGYKASENLKAEANLTALKQAITNYGNPIIHHSDRGTQYTSNDYIGLLKLYGVKISMCRNAQENAYAERINRTIKEEYLLSWQPKNFKQLSKMLKKATDHYNNIRLHDSLNRTTPANFEKYCKKVGRKNTPIMTIFDYQN